MIEPVPSPPGRRFQLEECLGRGGFGEVYRATMTSPSGIQSQVAVKVLHGDLDDASDALDRLRDEGRLLGLLDHPSIVRVIDLCRLEGRIALVTEYVMGADLKRCIRGSQPMPPAAVAEVVARLADALDTAWKTSAPDGTPLQLVHRDVKPANVRIGRRGEVKLLDFGIARASLRLTRTATNLLVGSFGYLAPERLSVRPDVGPAADVFSLGCVWYEALTHRGLLTELEQPTQVALSMSPRDFQAFVHERTAGLEGPARELVTAMLAHDQAARPTAADVSRAAESMLASAAGPSLRRWCQDRDWNEASTFSGSLRGVVLREEATTTRRAPLAPSAVPAPVDAPPAPVDDLPTEPATERSAVEVDPPETLSSPLPPSTTGSASVSTIQPARVAMAAAGLTGAFGVAAAVGVGLLAAVGLVGAAYAQWGAAGERRAEVTSGVEVVEPPAEVAEPPAEVAEPPAEVAEAPVEATEPPVTAEPPEPPSRQPEPEPRARTTPAAPARPMGVVTVTAALPVRLAGPAGTAAPGRVPVGHYTVEADFGSGWQSAGALDVAAGATVSVSCSRVTFTCGVR
jgi:serine/threonine protein kinase